MRYLLTLLLCAWVANGMEIQTRIPLRWSANTETNLMGYFLYWGPQPRVYTNQMLVLAPQTNATVPPIPGTTYYAISAVNTARMASDVSPEISTNNPWIVTLEMQEADTLTGPWLVITNQTWVGRGSTNSKFYRGRMTLEKTGP